MERRNIMYNIPILFIIFKRKDIALESFKSIRNIKPAKLYIAGDAARNGVQGEDVAVNETREAILNAIDWDCEVKTLFQKENLGCCMGVYSAINWLFESEEHGIILEDDCIAKPSFFPFVEELLNRYSNDDRIGMIAGTNLISDKVSIPDSYCFSRYDACWGWATWKRAWKNMDLDMSWRQNCYKESVVANNGYRSKDIKYWNYRIRLIDTNYVSAWDWQWYFTLAAQNQLCVFPSECLISNIGFGEGATHTSQLNVPKFPRGQHKMNFPLQHPKMVLPYEPFEKAFYKNNNTFYMNVIKYIPTSIKRIIKERILK